MMNYIIAQALSSTYFKRRSGIYQATLKQRVKALKPSGDPYLNPGLIYYREKNRATLIPTFHLS